MELRDYIDIGIEKAGSLTALGKQIDLSQPRMSKARTHKEHLPLDACVMLADYIGADRFAVIAANELATEKKEEKRAFWRPFVEHARAAALIMTIGVVTNFVTPSPAEAATALERAGDKICIM